ncbi:MAG: DNA polymerase III subunit gamma/tau [Myxococcales bacterium]|nr:MAG: DNA polymerase III subunit gamma/tau [Myxococcales bacterium]
MTYTVLARKYRPQSFEDLIGQEHVSRTLSNALSSDRVAHAFLFTGVRGVGKTSTARILAKALNCEKGPSPQPCGQCDPCKEITTGHDMDVIEIDGASNNSVEDIRRLQETLPFAPARDRFKVLIVDEVHMLSTSAFNALLKTLEEPPDHVKFILATTESHKVPITIRSRCQRYDYKLISMSAMAKRLHEIFTLEKIAADEETVSLVAREAAGSMRDALTLLDQVVAFGGTTLKHDDIARMLGVADRSAVFDIVESLLTRQSSTLLESVHQCLEQGLDLRHLLQQMLNLMRDLVVLKTMGKQSSLADFTETEAQHAEEFLATISSDELQRSYSMLSKLCDELAHSFSLQMDFEMGLLRIASSPALIDLGKLLSLEKGSSGPPLAVPKQSSHQPPNPAPRAISTQGSKTSPKSQDAKSTAAAAATASVSTASPESQLAHTTPAVASAPAENVDLLWQRVVQQLQHSRPALAAILEYGIPIELNSTVMVIDFEKHPFYAKQAQSREALDALAKAFASVLNQPDFNPKHIKITEGGGSHGQKLPLIKEKAIKLAQEQTATKKRALEHPIVREAMEVFPENAEKIDVVTDVD